MKILPFVFPVLLCLSGSFANAHSLSFAQPKLVKVPGTKVRLVPPTGLKPSERFPGFWDEETNSSIVITEMPAPYSEIATGFTKYCSSTGKTISLCRASRRAKSRRSIWRSSPASHGAFARSKDGVGKKAP